MEQEAAHRDAAVGFRGSSAGSILTSQIHTDLSTWLGERLPTKKASEQTAAYAALGSLSLDSRSLQVSHSAKPHHKVNHKLVPKRITEDMLHHCACTHHCACWVAQVDPAATLSWVFSGVEPEPDDDDEDTTAAAQQHPEPKCLGLDNVRPDEICQCTLCVAKKHNRCPNRKLTD